MSDLVYRQQQQQGMQFRAHSTHAAASVPLPEPVVLKDAVFRRKWLQQNCKRIKSLKLQVPSSGYQIWADHNYSFHTMYIHVDAAPLGSLPPQQQQQQQQQRQFQCACMAEGGNGGAAKSSSTSGADDTDSCGKLTAGQYTEQLLSLMACGSLQQLSIAFDLWEPNGRWSCQSASALGRLQDLTVDITVDKVAPTFDPINGLPVEPPSAAQSAVVLKDSFFAGLTALTALRVNIADATLPESFSTQLTGLQQLQLTCTNLTSLPCEISELSQLRVLRLRCAAQLQQLPEEVGSMPDLQELQLGELWQPLLLPASLSSHEALTCLHICVCTSYGNEDGDEPAHPYTMVDGLCAASMQSLQQLLLQRCSFPAGLELGGGSLQQLTMKHCRVGSVDLSGATSLQQLRLADVADLQHIHGVEDLCCLSVLDIRDCRSAQPLPAAAWQQLQQLQEMRLWDVGDLLGCLRSSNLRGLSSVTSMDISLASALSELPASFTALSSLQELRLRWVDLTALPAARDGLQSMRTLRLRECSKLSSIGPISSLTQLSIHGCGKLKRLPGLAGMSSLQELDICRCGALEQLPNSISQLTQLTRLHLSHLPAMKALPEGLCGLTSLQELRVTNCGSIKKARASLTSAGLSLKHRLHSIASGMRKLASRFSPNKCLARCVVLEFAAPQAQLEASVG
ncbi:hypothetical protein OEZ85_010767 [Tetradesmus obliquus]|uniref:Disease resistance protein At4g27190-like leucine-rich repeats domain-containing protein n=1 Tax=Tetradesmus obliquus TaxID=3088 RepID=A0ABY8TQD2_TETOB|nr:hypothetical protein OEZ85_010767 [Tetradesmus obliquus]